MRRVVVLFLFFAAIAFDLTGVWGNSAAVCCETTAEINCATNMCEGGSNVYFLKGDTELGPEEEEVEEDEDEDLTKKDGLKKTLEEESAAKQLPQHSTPEAEKQQQQEGSKLSIGDTGAVQTSKSSFSSPGLTAVSAVPGDPVQSSVVNSPQGTKHKDSTGNGSSPTTNSLPSTKVNEGEEQQQSNADGNGNSQLSEQLNTAHNNDNNGEETSGNTYEQGQTLQNNQNVNEESTSTNLPLAETTTATIVSNTTNDGAGVDINVLQQILFGVFICLLSPLTV